MAGRRKLFGTDGVRGEAGTFLSAELATSLGRAMVRAAGEGARPQVLIVRDTRESGPMLEAALASGISAAGGDALLGGVLPTPAVSILTRRYGFDRAAVVSASHNPYGDNGIKFFGPDGGKLADAEEERVESLLGESPDAVPPGHIRELRGALEDYLRALEGQFPLDLSGLTVALDCANGATYRAAPAIFERLGARVEAHADQPDGRNINDGCGSTHIGFLAERVAEGDADIGFAFDGDGDRVLAVDGSGRVHDGDELIALAASRLGRDGALGGGVAVTVMTNFGFHQAMEAAGVEIAVTDVGDRYILEALKERGWRLGGEQSGHIIDMDFAPTGDGIAAALATVAALDGRPLAEAAPIRKLPQTLVNVEVADRGAVEGATALWEAVEAENRELEGRGRVLVRPSGTEPVVRVMVEAPEEAEAEEVARRLVGAVQAELGSG
ncbi:MAG TPA: phosphoglucosamine mutase [Solirubrobacterales bacterium]|nr:phosphoglucosamine mutase [Solirubrobacterales bacterium]